MEIFTFYLLELVKNFSTLLYYGPCVDALPLAHQVNTSVGMF